MLGTFEADLLVLTVVLVLALAWSRPQSRETPQQQPSQRQVFRLHDCPCSQCVTMPPIEANEAVGDPLHVTPLLEPICRPEVSVSRRVDAWISKPLNAELPSLIE
jgi:hypothetical protein